MHFKMRVLIPNCLGHDGLEALGRDHVGAHVTGGTTVLEVALAVSLGGAGDTDGSTTVGDAVREFVNRGGFVGAGQTLMQKYFRYEKI